MITNVNEREYKKMSEKNLSPISDSEWEVMRIVWTLGETLSLIHILALLNSF